VAGKVRLEGGHGEEVVRGIWVDHEVCFSFYDLLALACISDMGGQAGAVFTAGEDGLVKVWRDDSGTVEEAGEIKGQKERRRRKEKRSDKPRYKPY
jgi:hypothetical protein